MAKDQEKEVTVESLQAELAEKKAEILEATTIIEAQGKTITELEAKVASLEKSPAQFPVITVGGKRYEVQVKSFQLGKEVITVDELLADEELQHKAVEKGFGFLVEIAE
ncbi:hypothetical protein ACFQ4C_18000 [Larkinella insperata]|uniref:Uncharacterized protein n=1 Tax=Larkinella insperata TaxID=332158 RepID=A0ABW3QD90_9BACT|nr:hypothetical protein [Larkinella insperata]